MTFNELPIKEQKIVLLCMQMLLETPLIEEPEFQSRLGISRLELSTVIASWPMLDDSVEDSVTNLAINNCLNEVCHGLHISDSIWGNYLDVPLKRVKQVYKNWLASEEQPQ